jgi:quercetin dioxygenase-like cupin family protein
VEENRTGYIVTIEEAAHGGGGAKGHPGLKGYHYMKEPAIYVSLGLDMIQTGGGIQEHYHECNVEMPVFDHIYYVISGQIRATVGDIEKTVGADSFIYCPSNVRHSILNVGQDAAKVLRITGSGKGQKMGDAVYSKK